MYQFVFLEAFSTSQTSLVMIHCSAFHLLDLQTSMHHDDLLKEVSWCVLCIHPIVL